MFSHHTFVHLWNVNYLCPSGFDARSLYLLLYKERRHQEDGGYVMKSFVICTPLCGD
jgi:hypothetical protein